MTIVRFILHLLLLASCACFFILWVRSNERHDFIYQRLHDGRFLQIESMVGSIHLGLQFLPVDYWSHSYSRKFEEVNWSNPSWDGEFPHVVLGFSWRAEASRAADRKPVEYMRNLDRDDPALAARFRSPIHSYGLLLPYWFLILVTGAWPA